jgi:hypothetical protein
MISDACTDILDIVDGPVPADDYEACRYLNIFRGMQCVKKLTERMQSLTEVPEVSDSPVPKVPNTPPCIGDASSHIDDTQ